MTKKHSFKVGDTVYIQGVWRAKIVAIYEHNPDMIYVKILEGNLMSELDTAHGTFSKSMLCKVQYAV